MALLGRHGLGLPRGRSRKLIDLRDPIDVEEQQKRLYEPDVVIEEPKPRTLEDHEFLHEFNPGHKHAYLFRKDKKGTSKANAYSMFVKEQLKTSKDCPRSADPFVFYGKKYSALPKLEREKYVTAAAHKNRARQEVTEVKAKQANMTKEQLWIDEHRREFGFNTITDLYKIRLYWPPEESGRRPMRGRFHYEDLRLARALYIISEKEERAKEELMMSHIETYFKPQDFKQRKIYVIGCIPLVDDPAPTKCIHQPLELFLTAFTLSDGLCNVAYHRFVRAGQGVKEEATDQSKYAAWYQAHLRHNLPYEGFDPLENKTVFPGLAHEYRYDGWDLYANRVCKFSTSHYDVYNTLHDILKEDVDGAGKLPPVFAKLRDCAMVDGCIEWLRVMAVKEATEMEMEFPVPDFPIHVSSLEHLAWHVGELTQHPLSEQKIELELNSDRFSHDYRLKCAYHEERMNELTHTCARATVLSAVYNMFQLLLEPCGVQKTKEHLPYR